jgi:prolyl oligopeptidase
MSSVTSEGVRVPSADGTRVPMSIVHAKDFAKDGSHPAWLVVYGSYGINLEPEFLSTGLPWIERGGLYAYCHARGGGELGAGWHQDGMMLKKQHSIDDMIACSQWLVDNRYTQTRRVAGVGGSAGGIVVGGAITQRPDLFGAAIILVGWSNPLRLEQTGVGASNVPELGTVQTPDGFNGLYAMDPYSHVRDGEKYPAVLLTMGANDQRTAPWQVTKMTARLQAATSSGKPVLLRVGYDSGHFGGSASLQDEELADEQAFLLSQIGEK